MNVQALNTFLWKPRLAKKHPSSEYYRDYITRYHKILFAIRTVEMYAYDNMLPLR